MKDNFLEKIKRLLSEFENTVYNIGYAKAANHYIGDETYTKRENQFCSIIAAVSAMQPTPQSDALDEAGLELAYYALLKEKSAQMGEGFSYEMFKHLKEFGNEEEFDEELVQVKCAIRAYLDAVGRG